MFILSKHFFKTYFIYMFFSTYFVFLVRNHFSLNFLIHWTQYVQNITTKLLILSCVLLYI